MSDMSCKSFTRRNAPLGSRCRITRHESSCTRSRRLSRVSKVHHAFSTGIGRQEASLSGAVVLCGIESRHAGCLVLSLCAGDDAVLSESSSLRDVANIVGAMGWTKSHLNL